tara:strand:+ start:4484 stop:4954 length:471 start_codon:yes stop_codon:yes gene_type:complete
MEDIEDLLKEVNELENNTVNNINKINIIIIKVNKNEIEDIMKKKQNIKNNNISNILLNEIVDKIKNNYCNNEYEIKYLLNFSIKKDMNELENLNNETIKDKKNYELNILKKLENINNNDIFFTKVNSLIFILNKSEKIYYIKRKKQKNNITKKLNK